MTGTFDLSDDTLLPAYTETTSGGFSPFTFTITTNVYQNSVTNGLDFVYQLNNTGLDVYERMTVSSFSMYGVNADYDALTGNVAPTTVDRSGDGTTVGYDFPGVAGGEDTDLLIVRTNATMVVTGSASVIDGSSANTLTEVPFGAATQVPEPASLGLVAMSLSFLARRRVRSGK